MLSLSNTARISFLKSFRHFCTCAIRGTLALLSRCTAWLRSLVLLFKRGVISLQPSLTDLNTGTPLWPRSDSCKTWIQSCMIATTNKRSSRCVFIGLCIFSSLPTAFWSCSLFVAIIFIDRAWLVSRPFPVAPSCLKCRELLDNSVATGPLILSRRKNSLMFGIHLWHLQVLYSLKISHFGWSTHMMFHIQVCFLRHTHHLT